MQWLNRTHIGDCRALLAQMRDDGIKVQTCVTSPPYFGLRDYGHADQIGLESSPAAYIEKLVEVFRVVRDVLADNGTLWLNLGDSYAGSGRGGYSNPETSTLQGSSEGQAQTPRQRGVTSNAQREQCPPVQGSRLPAGLHAKAVAAGSIGRNWVPPPAGFKAKDLMGMPWRVAFALQADGWYLRQDIIWRKPNPMPESVTDRCTKAHEYLFLLAKSEQYYWDRASMQEPAMPDTDGLYGRAYSGYSPPGQKAHAGILSPRKSGNKKRRTAAERGVPLMNGKHSNQCDSVPWEGTTRNRRSVWDVPVASFEGAHFATFPPRLIIPCVLAATPPRRHRA